jgi:hypothetical protein
MVNVNKYADAPNISNTGTSDYTPSETVVEFKKALLAQTVQQGAIGGYGSWTHVSGSDDTRSASQVSNQGSNFTPPDLGDGSNWFVGPSGLDTNTARQMIANADIMKTRSRWQWLILAMSILTTRI